MGGKRGIISHQGPKISSQGRQNNENPAIYRFGCANRIICRMNCLETELRTDSIMVCAAGRDPGTGFIFHNKKIAAVEMAVHFPDPFFINNIGLMNAMELRRQFF
jgi:hypothetical protein